jgi:adenylate cyclase
MSKRIPIFIGMLFVIFAIWLHMTANPIIRLVLLRLENIVYDMELRTHLLTHPQQLTNSVVAIVDIDDMSLHKEGRWPWPRAKLGELVDDLQAAGAVVIAFDMIFPQEEKNIVDEVGSEITKEHLSNINLDAALKKIQPLFNNDYKFSISMSDSDVVIGMSFLQNSLVTGVIPPPIIMLKTSDEKKLGFIEMNGVQGMNSVIAKGVKYAGFINVFSDSDGIIRRVPLLLRYHDGLYPSLALEAVRVYLLANIKLATAAYGNSQRVEGVQLNDYVIPTDSRGQVIIPFIGKSYTYPFFSATDVLHKKIPANSLAGKIVFIGTSSIGLGDLKATAIQSAYPGVEVHATVADGILKRNFSFKPAWAVGAEIVLIVVLGSILMFVCPYLGPRILTVLIILLPLLLLSLNNILREKTGLLIAIFIPMALSISIPLLNLVYGYLFETRRREHIKAMFGQYVPEEHIDEMLKTGRQYGLHGEDREMTVLFADIRNFTSISEHMSATQLKDYLHAYLNPMTEVIFKYHGTIDKYVGDLIMAFWGAPLQDKKHAKHAINAALDMQTELTKLNKVLSEKNLASIQIGIGLNSGMMSVGDMGSKFRLNYTVLGDSVNLGSRVEGLTKYYDVKIIATENTAQQQDTFLFRLLDRVRVKGKNESVAIYEVICRKNEALDDVKKEIVDSEEALHFYFQQDFEKARLLFLALSKHYPAKKIYSLYLERIAEFIKNPPPKDWDGVFTLMNK